MNIIEKAICYLAEHCDGAREKDGQGYNMTDSAWGKNLARFIKSGNSLSIEQLREALARLHKYREQLLAGGIDLDNENPINPDELKNSLAQEFLGQDPIAPNQIQTLPELGDDLLKSSCEKEQKNLEVVTISKPAVQSLNTNVYEVTVKSPQEQTTPDFLPTEEQQIALDKIQEWLETEKDGKGGKQEFKLGGYAGTGKTTIIKLLRKQSKDFFVVCAFTGKAVHVLQRKQVAAQTIHSLIYNVELLPKGQVVFHKKSCLESKPRFIIVDEASMISKELYQDLKSFNIPLLFVGDPGQLEPIGDNPNLMANPDFVLNKIHRQAESSPIISFANNVRKGGRIQYMNSSDLKVKQKDFKASEAVKVDQIICARNKTRLNMNTGIRAYKGFPPNTIVEGDKLICLRNNINYGVFNGMIFFVEKICEHRPQVWICNLVDELGNQKTFIPIWRPPIEMPIDTKDLVVPKDVVYCDFGYVVTCHKAQGSEWDSVIVFDEWMPAKVWDMRRWRYTAITRAAKQLTYLF